MFVPTLFDIPLLELKEKGIEAIIFDLDNTIIAWECREVETEIILWMNNLKKYGFDCCIVSNNLTDRVGNIAKILNVAYVSKGYKPLSFGFRNALNRFALKPSQVAVVGDQIFTDILGGNFLKLYTILVRPLSTQEFIGTKVVRIIEKLILKNFKV
ncbi:MAG: superfamily [Firmicutes bacterium]|nr:superfamily [Bacillota bacterium]